MPRFRAEYLRSVTSDILCAAGAPEDEADVVAASLVQSNLFGHDSHGVIRVPQYVDSMQAGQIQPGAHIEVEQEAAASAALNGNWGFGQVIARRATEMAIAKAKRTAVGCVTVRQCNHVGRLGEYTGLAAEADTVAIMTVNNHGAAQRMAPWGGTEPRLSPNPVSFAAPRGRDRPILVDITSTVVAEGKVRVARNKGERIPEGWAIDVRGQPITDPKDFYASPRGALLPFGGIVGHKGFALGVMVDILSGALSGAGCSRRGGTRNGNALFIMVADIARFTSLESFKQEVDDLADYIKSSAMKPGVSEILMPGEPEYRVMEARERDGIYVEERTWEQICACARDVGAQVPPFGGQ